MSEEWPLVIIPGPGGACAPVAHVWQKGIAGVFCVACNSTLVPARAALASGATLDDHRLMMPPHPGDVYRASALCSCGGWQYDESSPGSLTAAYKTILADHTAHALSGAVTGCPDPEHPGGAYCSGTTGLHTCYPPKKARLSGAVTERGECWFCRREVPIDYLIAGYDTFEEQRLACDDCDRAFKGLADRRAERTEGG